LSYWAVALAERKKNPADLGACESLLGAGLFLGNVSFSQFLGLDSTLPSYTVGSEEARGKLFFSCAIPKPVQISTMHSAEAIGRIGLSVCVDGFERI